MPAKKKHTPKRSPDQATLTISLPKEMKRRIKNAADSDNRTTSNYVLNEMAKILAKSGFIIIVGLLAFHAIRSPRKWTPAALVATAKTAFVHVAKLAR